LLDPFDLKVLVRTLVLPPAGPLLLAVAGLVLAQRRPRLGRRLVIAGVAITWILSMPVVGDGLARWVEAGERPLEQAAWEASRSGARPPGAVVVLGAGVVSESAAGQGAERLDARALQRTLAAARVARATGLPVLTSGGRPSSQRQSEAELMRRVLEDDLGVRVRWVEDRSRDTAENAGRSADLLRAEAIDSVVLVTHAFHMGRARRAFESAGLAVLAAPHDWYGGPSRTGLRAWLPAADALATSWFSLHELVGRAWYVLRGRG
jgi:uncharacterized SAM-binding protein YcdF (DUF218 family)